MTKNRSHATVIALSGRSSTEFSIGCHFSPREARSRLWWSRQSARGRRSWRRRRIRS